MKPRSNKGGGKKRKIVDANSNTTLKVAENVSEPKNYHLERCSQPTMVPSFPKKLKMQEEAMSVMSELTGTEKVSDLAGTRCNTDDQIENIEYENTGEDSQNCELHTGDVITDQCNTSQAIAGFQTAKTLPTVPSTSPQTPEKVAGTVSVLRLPGEVGEKEIEVQTRERSTEVFRTAIPENDLEISPTPSPETRKPMELEEKSMPLCMFGATEQNEYTTSISDSAMDVVKNKRFSPIVHDTSGNEEIEDIRTSHAAQRESLSEGPIEVANTVPLPRGNIEYRAISEPTPVINVGPSDPTPVSNVGPSDQTPVSNVGPSYPTPVSNVGPSECSQLKETNSNTDHDISDSVIEVVIVSNPIENNTSEDLSPIKQDQGEKEQHVIDKPPYSQLDCTEEVISKPYSSSQADACNWKVTNYDEKLGLSGVDTDKDTREDIVGDETSAQFDNSNPVCEIPPTSNAYVSTYSVGRTEVAEVHTTTSDDEVIFTDSTKMDKSDIVIDANLETEEFFENKVPLNLNPSHTLCVPDKMDNHTLFIAPKEQPSEKQLSVSNIDIDEAENAFTEVSQAKKVKKESSQVSIHDDESDIDITDSQLCEAVNIEESNNQQKTLDEVRKRHLEGRKVLHDLIVDLSYLNKLLLRTKREIQYAKRNRQSQSFGMKRLSGHGVEHRRF